MNHEIDVSRYWRFKMRRAGKEGLCNVVLIYE